MNFFLIHDSTTKAIFSRRQAEKTLVFILKYLQKLTFCRIAILLLIMTLMIAELSSEGFCTTNNLNKFCGVNVLEYDIDTARISPSNKCKKVFFWIPPFSKAGEEKCYICGEENSIPQLGSLVNSKNKKCGRLILAGKL